MYFSMQISTSEKRQRQTLKFELTMTPYLPWNQNSFAQVIWSPSEFTEYSLCLLKPTLGRELERRP